MSGNNFHTTGFHAEYKALPKNWVVPSYLAAKCNAITDSTSTKEQDGNDKKKSIGSQITFFMKPMSLKMEDFAKVTKNSLMMQMAEMMAEFVKFLLKY